MAVKYTIPFKADDNSQWRVDIENDAYSGEVISVRGVGGQSVIRDLDGAVDDPFFPIIKSSLIININQQGNIDYKELKSAQDRTFKVKLYQEDSLKWFGYLQNDNMQRPLKALPFALTLAATDGLSMLDDIPYVHADLPGTGSETSRCPMNYIRQILFSNLGITLPIRWTNQLRCTAFPTEDVMTGSVTWSPFNEGIYSYQSGPNGDEQGPLKSCGYILKGMLESMQCRIYQENGRWNIRRVNDVTKGFIQYKQIAGDLGVMTVQSGNENLLNQIGRKGYRFVNEDAIMTTVPGIKTSRVTYKANVRNNIVPNGSQDVLTDGVNPLYWGFYGPAYSSAIAVPPLDNRTGGHATKLYHYYNIGIPQDAYYTLVSDGGTLGNDGLPIDTQTLIKQINFGFTFSPISGFPVDGDGFIIWDSKPFKIQVIFNAGSTKYYLNEFGFWQTDAVEISIVVEQLKLNDVAQINFDKFRGIIMPTPDSPPVAGDISDIQIIFNVHVDTPTTSKEYELDNIYINIDRGDEVYEATLDSSKNTSVDKREIEISSSFSGYMLSNFMTRWSASDEQCAFSDGLLYEGALTDIMAQAIMRFRNKSSEVFNGSISVLNNDWTFDEIYLIDSFLDSRFLPLKATYNIEKCEVNLIAMECRNDSIIFTKKYYNSNDNQLSN